MPRLKRNFYNRPTVDVARDLLGRTLVHQSGAGRLAGRIVETEAYSGFDDEASHGYRGKTERNAVMFGTPGFSYVYFIYGNYWMMNVVSRPHGADYPGAVLIRALEPLEGLELMASNRPGQPQRDWTNGPGKLTLAMNIDARHSGIDLTTMDSPLFLETGQPVPDTNVATGPRVGLGRRVSEPWLSKAWRFWIQDSQFVSK
jgi:DNA-3-methyladenine glycosylase